MNIQDAATELGPNLSVNVLHPEKGDLLVLKFDSYLSRDQRDKIEATFKPVVTALGCRFTVLEGGADLLLVKKVALESEVSTASANERLETVEKTASRVRDELQHAAS